MWRVFGVEPPVAANYISLAFGYATLFVGYRFIARMQLPEALAPKRWALVALVMLGTVSNRTFLTWLSSGLETSLFNFLFIWWIYVGTTPAEDRSKSWGLRLSAAATLTALTRPDGLLVAAVTPLMLIAAQAGSISSTHGLPQLGRRVLLALRGGAPLVGVAGHLVWRRLTYDDWLPNTYTIARSEHKPSHSYSRLLRAFQFRVGGDHFEYRVYSYTILLLFVSAVWLLSWMVRCWPSPRPLRAWVVFVGMALFIACSWPIPWSHWAQTHNRAIRAQTFYLIQPLAPSFPAWTRPIITRWDGWQAWLIGHSVCMRHQEHKVFSQFQRNWLPERGQSKLRLEGQGRAVATSEVVGVVGWVLRDVAVIDMLGLNDYVIARNPDIRGEERHERQMAHDRKPPDGYLECFRPNVAVGIGLYMRPRSEPLTDAEIIACETKPWY